METINITDNDNNRIISAAIGQVVVVSLDENPTTGFQWFVNLNSGDAWSIVSNSFSPKITQKIGGAGTRVLRLQARKYGKDQFVAELRRNWGGQSINRRLMFNLVCEQ